MSEPSARRAVWLLAGVELRRGLVGLVVLGVCAGLVGGLIGGSIALARRTSSAFDRLASETWAEDARINVFAADSPDTDTIESMPGVTGVRAVSIGVGRLDGPEVVYLGILSASPSDVPLFRPIVVDGRMPDPEAPDEAVIAEYLVDSLGVGVGDHLPVTMLTPEETTQFDTGFGEPDGPSVDLVITGVVRVLPSVMDSSPVLTSPAFADTYGDAVHAGEIVMIAVDDVDASREALVAEVAALNAEAAPSAGGSEFLAYDIEFVEVARQQFAGAARVLVVGLVAFAAVGGIAGAFAVGQALLRREGANSDSQEIESALGLDGWDRVAIRVLPALPVAVLAAGVAAAVGLGAASLSPPGSLAGIEPHPGQLIDWWSIVLSALGAGVALLLLTAGAAWFSGRPGRTDSAPGPAADRLLSGTGNPELAASVAFALAAGRGRQALPARTAIVSTVIGVAGLVGALTFATSLNSLENRPSSWGWPGSFSVVDVSPEIEEALVNDARVGALGVVATSSGVLDGQSATLSSTTEPKGSIDWTVIEGRRPDKNGEIGLGTRLAERLGTGVGDDVVATALDGSEATLRVVSIMLMPKFDTGPLGNGAVVTPDDQETLRHSDPLTEAVVVVAPGTDAGALVDEFGGQWELFIAEPPPEVENLLDLGSLPLLLGLFVATVGMVAMANALVIAIRRLGRELSVLRSIGFTHRQVRVVIIGMAVTTAAVGIVIGVPLGLALGRFVWWAAAADAGLGTSIDVPLGAIVSIVAAVAIVAALIGVLPGRDGLRRSGLAVLRTE